MPPSQQPAPNEDSYYVHECFLSVNVRACLTSESLIVILTLPDQVGGGGDYQPFLEDCWREFDGYGSVYMEMELQIWASAAASRARGRARYGPRRPLDLS